MNKQVLIFTLLVAALFAAEKPKEEWHTLSLKDFVTDACRNDLEFQNILMDTLQLKYRQLLARTPAELLLEVTGEYGISLSGEQRPEGVVSLQQLFPSQGSALTGTVRTSRSPSTNVQNSQLEVRYSIDLWRNAFGKAELTKGALAGVENNIIRNQVIEAYEKYLAELYILYYSWLQAYNELQFAQIQKSEAETLLRNIKKRKRRFIARQVDVDKATLQVLNADREIGEKEGIYIDAGIRVAFVIGTDRRSYNYVPNGAELELSFKRSIPVVENSFAESRTGLLYEKMLSKDSLSQKLLDDALLPSLSLYGGIDLTDIRAKDNSKVVAGVTLSFPVHNRNIHLEKELVDVERQKIVLRSRSSKLMVETKMYQMSEQIIHKKKMIADAEKRLELSKKILKAESVEYQYGRTTLNNILQAQNSVHSNRRGIVQKQIEVAKLWVALKELADTLVLKNK
ncbi:MAG: TolC family protein [Fibrobacterales bacterium]